ncbi:MAG: methyltransferase [Nanoarchaeota archaeon]|nr:methyltransferase [Nanoarchaeota archaeon]
MKAVAITHKGIEDIAALEVKELIKVSSKVKETVVLFEPKKIIDLCTLAYKAQSIIKVTCLFDEFKIQTNFNDILKIIEKKIKKINLDKWLDKNKSFKVLCRHLTNDDFSSQDIEKETGAFIINNIKEKKAYEQKVDLENPDLIFYVYIFNERCYLGIDFCGFDLSKRDYKVFSSASDIKGTIAYSLLRIAGYKKQKKLLDPFCGSGVIPIEAALYNNGSVNYYRKEDFAFLKLKPFEKQDFDNFFNKQDSKNKPFIAASDQQLYHIRSAKKNAKIAGVNKNIEFSRADLEWLDTRFDKNEIDLIATKPIFSKYDLKKTKKTYDEFFYAAKYILSEKGKIVLISRAADLLKESAEKHGFKITDERIVWQGQQKLNITIFIK